MGVATGVSIQRRPPSSRVSEVESWSSRLVAGFTLWNRVPEVVGPPSAQARLVLRRRYQGRLAGVSKPRLAEGMAGRWRYFFTGSA